MDLDMSKKISNLKYSIRNQINQILPKPTTLIENNFLENLKTSVFEDSIYLGFDVFVLSKIALFFRVFWVLAAKQMSLFNTFFCSKIQNTPLK